MKILVTGGAGFIGSAFIRMAVEQTDWRIVNLDKLTYAGNLDNLTGVEGNPRYRFVRVDLCEEEAVRRVFEEECPDAIAHFAAESHVDRTILFAPTGVHVQYWRNDEIAGGGAKARNRPVRSNFD